MTGTALRTLSPEAERINLDAKIEVDRYERSLGEPISMEEAANIYRNAVGAFAHKARMEELKPVMDYLTRLFSLYIGPQPAIPDEVQSMIDASNDKWAKVYEELAIADSPDTARSTRSQRMRAAGFTRRPSSRSLPSDE